MHSLQVIDVLVIFFCYKTLCISSETIYYAVNTFGSPNPFALYGSIHTFNTTTTQFPFFANFSFHVDDNDTTLYDFEPGPVAIVNHSSPLIYIPVQCGTSFERLVLLVFDLEKRTAKQSGWILHDGHFHYLFYDPVRQRLFGLRDISTFTLIIEEYNITTLDVVQQYTQQDGEKYAFPHSGCVVFDYEENWIVEVRTRFESSTVNAYYVKMDLNLVGKKEDIVTEFYLMPNVNNLCSMTYDIKTKNILSTWQHGSIDRDLVMIYMDPYTSKFSNETLLFKVQRDWVIEETQAVYDEKTRQILFMIQYEQDTTFKNEYWIMLVEFDTMQIVMKKQVKTIDDFPDWELFIVHT